MKKRLLSWMLVLCMIIGLAPMSTVDVQAAEDYRAWAQSDSRWGG